MEYLIWELGERSVGEASQARLQSRGSSQGRVWSKGPGRKEGERERKRSDGFAGGGTNVIKARKRNEAW